MSQGQDVVESSEATAPPTETPVVEPAGSLGARLRKAREAGGYSIADVVQVIRFSAHQIEALERDEYTALPGATSARGLVRNYAKFLKLDPTPLLALLEPSVPVPEADVRPPTNMGEAEQVALAERLPMRAVIAVCALLVIALGAFWYFDSPDGSTTVKRPPVADAPVAKDPIPPAPSGGEAVSLATPAKTVVSDPPVPAGNATAVQIAAGLRLEFDDRSWIEVRDATQKIVLVGEFPAGTRQNVEGKAPYQLWIGRASAVRVFMGERAIDLRPHTREEVARLNLE